MIIESIQRGFQIANHSYSHPHFSKISLEHCQLEIEKTDQIIQSLYDCAKVSWEQKWFRFPYGDKGDLRNGEVFNPNKKSDTKRNNFIQNVLRKLNYSQPSWDEVNYNFMTNANLFVELDWHWTFDIMEWATLEYKPTMGIKNLHKIIQRLKERMPKDCRGNIGLEKRWLSSKSAEIILLHDHEETTPIFNSIVNKLLELPLEFKRK